jgi:hypothetical protein
METAVPKFAPTEKVALYVRQVFLGLRTPTKTRYQPWKLREDDQMMALVGAMYWRHFIPTVAASIDIGKEQRDYVGRWPFSTYPTAFGGCITVTMPSGSGQSQAPQESESWRQARFLRKRQADDAAADGLSMFIPLFNCRISSILLVAQDFFHPQ